MRGCGHRVDIRCARWRERGDTKRRSDSLGRQKSGPPGDFHERAAHAHDEDIAARVELRPRRFDYGWSGDQEEIPFLSLNLLRPGAQVFNGVNIMPAILRIVTMG